MCIHDGMNEECNGRCYCDCMNCMFPEPDEEEYHTRCFLPPR